MTAPKTRTLPKASKCCVLDIWVFRSSRDPVANLRGGAPDDQKFWEQWGGPKQTFNVNPGGEGLDVHAKIGSWIKKTQLDLMEEYKPGQWAIADKPSPAPDIKKLIEDGKKDYDDVLVCHSQGCNIMMHALNRICQPKPK